MQIEVARMVAAEPADAFAVVANVLEWPLIVRSVKSIELLTRDRSEPEHGCGSNASPCAAT